MGYWNFARRGYEVLNPYQGGECWDLGGGGSLTFEFGDPAGNRGSMHFTRPRAGADRIQSALGVGLSGPEDRPNLAGGVSPAEAGLLALVSFFNAATSLLDDTPVSTDVNVFGIGFDDGHAGSRERDEDQFDQAVEDLGRGWLRQYKQKLGWGGFFSGASGWYTRGAIASQYDVMIVRLDDSGSQLEISNFYTTRDVCRLVSGYAVRTRPQLGQG